MNTTTNNNTKVNVDVKELNNLLFSGNDKAYMTLINEVTKQRFSSDDDLNLVLNDIGFKYIVTNAMRKLRKEKGHKKFEFNFIEFKWTSNNFMYSEIIDKIEELLNKDFVVKDYYSQWKKLYEFYNIYHVDDEFVKGFFFDMYNVLFREA